MALRCRDNPVKIHTPQQKFRALLKQIFQFEHEELDFGIYRIINHNKERLHRFVESDLLAQGAESRAQSAEHKAQGVKRRARGEKNAAEALEAEVYNHLIRFFSRYYQEGDFIPRRCYGTPEKYAIPYNGEALAFYWVNKEQYYVKSSEFFSKYRFQAGDTAVQFRIVKAETEKGNAKARHKKYFLPGAPAFRLDSGRLSFFFEYRALNAPERQQFGAGRLRQANINREFIETLGREAPPGSPLKIFLEDPGRRALLETHLNRFTRRQNRDYFIHKDLRGFLERELDFFLKNEVVNLEGLERGDDPELAQTLQKARLVREIADKVIGFLARAEEFQKKLWEKKSFVLGSEYVITLSKIREIAGEPFLDAIIPEILTNRGQLAEWQHLHKFQLTIGEMQSSLFPLNELKWQHLPLDTAHFSEDFKHRLLNALSADGKLDQRLDGVLLHSDNWQALNLLRDSFAGKVQTVYIDPPFNKEQEADYFYKVGYKDSTWNTLLENRIRAARPLIGKAGCMFVRCDYNGSMYVRLLLDEIFGRENFRNEIVINRTRARQTVDKQFAIQTESLFLYSQTEKFSPRLIERPTAPRWFHLLHFPRKDERPRTVLGRVFYPPPNRRWALSQEKIDALAERGKIRINKNLAYRDFRGEEIAGMPEILYDSETVGNEWLDIAGYAQRHHFPTENAEALLQRVIETTSQPGDWVMDFFLGSGTAAAMAHKMGRKWIGIELGEHFHSVILPRMKKALFGDKPGISREIGWQGGGFFKYHTLEQFDDALENLRFEDAPPPPDDAEDHFVRYLLNYQVSGSATLLDVSRFGDPFNYRLKILHNSRQQGGRWVSIPLAKPPLSAAGVDLPETFNYLLGLTVKRLFYSEHRGNRYTFIFGERGGERVAVVWRTVGNLDYQADREFIEQTIAGFAPQKLYANGDCAVEGCISIERELRERMMRRGE